MNENHVVFEQPDYNSRQVLDTLVRALTGQSLVAFEKEISDNAFGKYDDFYKEENT